MQESANVGISIRINERVVLAVIKAGIIIARTSIVIAPMVARLLLAPR